jgi:hypothetical protein
VATLRRLHPAQDFRHIEQWIHSGPFKPEQVLPINLQILRLYSTSVTTNPIPLITKDMEPVITDFSRRIVKELLLFSFLNNEK